MPEELGKAFSAVPPMTLYQSRGGVLSLTLYQSSGRILPSILFQDGREKLLRAMHHGRREIRTAYHGRSTQTADHGWESETESPDRVPRPEDGETESPDRVPRPVDEAHITTEG